MRKFIIRTLLFLAFMFVIDRMAGMALHYLSVHPKGGMTFHRNHLTNQITEDVLVMGSSRARFHYDPKVVTEMTGLSCFNCGEDGHGILLFYAWWKLISQRYHPRLVIYDISPQYDLFTRDNHRDLGLLRRFYDDREEIMETIERSAYSRIPVYEDSIDNIIGILSLNHFLKACIDDIVRQLDGTA